MIYFIDNSADDRYRILEKQSDKIRYIHNKNLGYGTSHKVALREAIGIGSDFHLILNTDIRFELSILHEAISYLQRHPEVAYLSPKVLSPNGEVQHLRKLLLTPFDLIFRRFIPKYKSNAKMERYVCPKTKRL